MCVGFKIQTTKQMHVFVHSLEEGFTVVLPDHGWEARPTVLLSMQCDHVNEGTPPLVSGRSLMPCALRRQKNIGEQRKNRLAWLCSPFLVLPLELL